MLYDSSLPFLGRLHNVIFGLQPASACWCPAHQRVGMATHKIQAFQGIWLRCITTVHMCCLMLCSFPAAVAVLLCCCMSGTYGASRKVWQLQIYIIYNNHLTILPGTHLSDPPTAEPSPICSAEHRRS